jgi:hypothetical protein
MPVMFVTNPLAREQTMTKVQDASFNIGVGKP